MSDRTVRHALAGLASGLLFALGLGLSGMTNPDKVLAFLDLGGDWDPSLLLVMGAAVPVHAVAWWALKRRGAPLLGGEIPARPAPVIDARLVGGAALFGVGWGLSGVCPGPGVVNLAAGGGGLVFIAALMRGVGLSRFGGKRHAGEELPDEEREPAS